MLWRVLLLRSTLYSSQTLTFFDKLDTAALLWSCYKKHFSSHFFNAWPLSSVLRFIVGNFGCKIVGIIVNNNFTSTAVQRSRSWANFSECCWIWSIDYSYEHRHIPTLLSLKLQVALLLCNFHSYSGIFICRSNSSSHASLSLLGYKRSPWKYTKIPSFG